jgi:hypothetical protein
MQGIREEQVGKLWQRIAAYQMDALTEKDQEVLCGLIHTEPMLKALGQLLAFANGLPHSMIQLRLTDPEQLEQAIRTQGLAQGYIQSIESLLALITLPEETDDDDSTTSDE